MKPLLTVLLCLSCLMCLSQKNTDSLFFAHMQSRKISLYEKPYDTIYNLPFHNIQILDARPDTSSIGFLRYGGTTNKLYLEKGLANTFTNFINTNYKLSKDTNNLLILIKEFRVSDYASKLGLEDVNISQWNSGIIISGELFLNNGNNYRALYKVDSILVVISNNETAEESVERSFRAILRKSQDKSLSEMHIGKTAFSFDDIKKHIDDFVNFPVLKSTTYNKGVYKNFNEFKTNNPSIINFEIKKGKLSDELFINDGNQSYPIQDFWGYCNGKNLFIYSAKNLFQLIRTGNTFNIRGMKSFKTRKTLIKDTTTYLLGNLILTGRQSNDYLNYDKFKSNITAFQLNMQNGELY